MGAPKLSGHVVVRAQAMDDAYVSKADYLDMRRLSGDLFNINHAGEFDDTVLVIDTGALRPGLELYRWPEIRDALDGLKVLVQGENIATVNWMLDGLRGTDE